jgi:hypothetical protein
MHLVLNDGGYINPTSFLFLLRRHSYQSFRTKISGALGNGVSAVAVFQNYQGTPAWNLENVKLFAQRHYIASSRGHSAVLVTLVAGKRV